MSNTPNQNANFRKHFLDFEQPIAELEAKIDELSNVGFDNEINISEEISTLQGKSRKRTSSISHHCRHGKSRSFPVIHCGPIRSIILRPFLMISMSYMVIVHLRMMQRLLVGWRDSMDVL